ncbi:hypothetical protein [Vibrio quintilis]|uniref:Uncharacterized protein n=1 Tax=Vibrio quintilis TaxID=1117707 RepID=A0A1M7YQM8_9VIBR|nr:hypothetical protein [Vibrio quintilis]SHO54934.1 hypothetical protein VQ7734_00653 [Vibrio quintilis]
MNHKTVCNSAAFDLNHAGKSVYTSTSQTEMKPENNSGVTAHQANQKDNVVILSEHPYEALKASLAATCDNHPEMLCAEVRNTLQRLLEYKELLLHKDVLDTRVLKDFYSAMPELEQVVVDRGMDEISSAIYALDALIS